MCSTHSLVGLECTKVNPRDNASPFVPVRSPNAGSWRQSSRGDLFWRLV